MKTKNDPTPASCPQKDCPGKRDAGDIVVHSRKEGRYRCKRCGKTFSHTVDTPFYRLHHPPELVEIVLSLLSHGCPLPAIVFTFGLREETVTNWLLRGGAQAQWVHAAIVGPGSVQTEHIQADELYVRCRRGQVWIALALAVESRLWLAGEISQKRTAAFIHGFMRKVRRVVASPAVLLLVDGLQSYGRDPFHELGTAASWLVETRLGARVSDGSSDQASRETQAG